MSASLERSPSAAGGSPVVLGLAWVAIVTREPERVCRAFEALLGLPRLDSPAPQRLPLYGVGASRIVVATPGDPFVDGETTTGVHHIALETADPGGTLARVRAAGLDSGPEGQPSTAPALEPDGSPAPGAAIALPLEATCGIRTRLARPWRGSRPPPAPRAERIDHIGVATDRLGATERCLVEVLGLAVESRQTDSELSIALETFTSDRYGIYYHTRAPVATGGGRVTFITAGDTELEVIEPLDLERLNARHGGGDGGRPGDTARDMGTLARFVARRGPGLHHVAFKVPECDEALARFREAGYETIDREGRPGSRLARIGFVHPRAMGGVLIHFDAREPLPP